MAGRRLRDLLRSLSRAGRRLRRMPSAALCALALALLLAADLAFQLARKPAEIAALVAPTSRRTPAATWAEYRPLFEAHSTDVVRPELLAALVQVESAGDPLARTSWRWRWSWNPLQVYRPASSAVGLLQMTDGAYAQARRLCIHRHAVARAGPWWDPRGCWLNGLYSRAIPSHAIEMTSALLHQSVVETLARRRIAGATPEEEDRLAAVIHLCGRRRGSAFALRGFRAAPGERCSGHDVSGYLRRVRELEGAFARMRAEGRAPPPTRR